MTQEISKEEIYIKEEEERRKKIWYKNIGVYGGQIRENNVAHGNASLKGRLTWGITKKR